MVIDVLIGTGGTLGASLKLLGENSIFFDSYTLCKLLTIRICNVLCKVINLLEPRTPKTSRN